MRLNRDIIWHFEIVKTIFLVVYGRERERDRERGEKFKDDDKKWGNKKKWSRSTKGVIQFKNATLGQSLKTWNLGKWFVAWRRK